MVEPFPVFFVLLLIEFGTAELQLKIVNFAQSAQCHVSWRQEVTPVVQNNNLVDPRYCRTEVYAGRVACCPLVRHGEYAQGTDGRTPDRYMTLLARRSQCDSMGFMKTVIEV